MPLKTESPAKVIFAIASTAPGLVQPEFSRLDVACDTSDSLFASILDFIEV